MRYVVDRIEEDIVVLEEQESGEIINMNLSKIPFIIKEGDVIIYENDEWNSSIEEKEIIDDRIKKKMEDLWN